MENYLKDFFLLALTAGLLTSCSYGSLYEANNACKEWQEKGGSYKYEMEEFNLELLWNNPKRRYIKTFTRDLRWCKLEEETNQFLGFEIQNSKKDTLYKLGELDKKIGRHKVKVVKRFKY